MAGSRPALVPVPPSAAATTLSQIMTSLDVNLLGTVHGGVVMRLVDSVAGAA
ncbi:MAG: acyl-CoA thioesterase, partial [Candidatus Nanopelagicales bacterium]